MLLSLFLLSNSFVTVIVDTEMKLKVIKQIPYYEVNLTAIIRQAKQKKKKK